MPTPVNTFGQPLSQASGSPVPASIPMGGGFGQYGSQTPPGTVPNVPAPKPVTTISSDSAIQTIAENNKRLQDLSNKGITVGSDGLQRYADGSLVQGQGSDGSKTTGSYVGVESGLQDLRAQGGTYAGIDGRQYYTYDQTPVISSAGTPMTEGDQSVQRMVEQLSGEVDANTKQMVDAIHAQYQNLRAQQEEINKGLAAGREQSLIMGGSQRYAQESAAGQMAAQLTAGLREIANLNAQENAAIAQARAAAFDKKFQLMGKLIDQAENIRKEKAAVAKTMSEKLVEENKKAREETRLSSIEGVIGDLLSQGITDPKQIFDFINYKEDGSFTGANLTSEELAKAMKNLTTSKSGLASDLKNDVDKFEYLKSAGMLPSAITSLDPSKQYFAYLNMQKLADSGKLGEASAAYGGGGSNAKPGVGATDATQETIIRARLFNKLMDILNRGQVSESDAARISSTVAQLRGAGLSEQEILDQLSGFPTSVSSPYNDAFRDVIIGMSTTPQEQTQTMQQVSQLLNSGNHIGAMQTIERRAMEKALTQKGKDEFVSLDDVQYVKEKVDQITAELGKGWNEVGLFTGPMSLWLSQKFGTGNSARMKAKLGSLVSGIIQKRAGSAITESEWKRIIEPNIPSMTDSAATWKTKLEELYNDPLIRLNAERSLVALPAMNIDQAVDPKKRLELYRHIGASVPSSLDKLLNSDGSAGSATGYDPDVWGNI